MTHKILSIDPATTCGWALSPDLYGTWNLKTRKDESWGMKLIRLRGKLVEIYQAYPFSICVYERPAGRNIPGIITQSKIIGVIESFCEEMDVAYRAYSAGEIKKFATGKGNCGKPAMIEAAQKKYGYEGDDDDIADALHLLHLAKSELL